MDTSILLEYVRPELLIVVVFVYCIGVFLKKIPSIKDWTIPVVLLVISILITIMYIAFVLDEGIAVSIIVSGVIQGTIVAAVAVFGENIKKQLTEKRY